MTRKGRVFFLSALCLALLVSPVWGAETIKIGSLVGLTGDFSAYGQAESQSAQLAVDEINAAGGVKGKMLELVVYDFRSRVDDAVNAVRRMIEEDQVMAILGGNASGVNIATAPLVNRSKVPQVGTMPTNPLVTVDEKGNVRPYSFRICFTDPYQGKLIAYFTTKNLGKMKAAILYDVASDFAQGLREFFIDSYEEYGGKIVSDLGFRGGQDIDFRAQLTAIGGTDAEVLILPNVGKDCALIVKQLRELGQKDIIVVGADGYGDFMWEITGDALEGSYWITHLSPEDEGMQPFFQSYREKYKDECKEFANGVMAYDGLYWIADALGRAKTLDREGLRNALEDTKNLKLHHAVITIDPVTHNPLDKEGVILIAQDGKSKPFVKIKP